MPAYEYVCNDCKNDFLVYLSIREFEEKPMITCTKCGSKNLQRKITGFFAKTSKKS